MAQNENNTLKLIIKQSLFDRIVSGELKELSQEINESNFSEFLDYDEDEGFLILEEVLADPDADEELDLYMYNNGRYPFVPKNWDFIELSAGPVKDRKSIVVTITDISFEVARDSKGREIRFNWDEEGEIEADENGKSALWTIVYHL